MSSQGFSVWLKSHKDEKTEVGEFATTVLEDSSFPNWGSSKTIYAQYMREHTYPNKALRALDAIWSAYMEYQRNECRVYRLTIPPDVYTEVEESAKRNFRTFNNEILCLLEYALREAKKSEHKVTVEK